LFFGTSLGGTSRMMTTQVVTVIVIVIFVSHLFFLFRCQSIHINQPNAMPTARNDKHHSNKMVSSDK
jgi:hypothetical protein